MSNTVYGNLSNQFPTTPPFTGTLNTDIGNLNDKLTGIQNNSRDVLTQQGEIKKIVDAESTRLQQKKQSVNNAYSSQLRATYMNNNVQKRYNAYLKILFVVVIVLIIVFFLSIIGNYFPIIPSFLINILYIGLFSFLIIYSISIYSEIQKHDKMDFDKLYLNTSIVGNGSDISDNSMNLMSDGLNGYCPYHTDESGRKVCNEEFNGNNELQSLNTFEFTHYSRY
jgi:hypothetical protein